MDNLSRAEDKLKKLIFETGDEWALDSYVKLKSVRRHQYLYFEYLKAFGLCRALGVTNLYDIGCGQLHQALLLSKSPDMYYTGIDSNCDFDDLNRLCIELNLSDNIKFLKAEYPFDITPASNNIAVSYYALGALSITLKGSDAVKKAAKALSRDFERILITINPEVLNIWENELSDFALHTLGYDAEDGKTASSIPTILATKFQEDISKLNDMNFNYYNNKFIIDFLVL